MKRLSALALVLCLAVPGMLSGQERLDAQMIAKIRSEGFERSEAIETFSHLTTVIGPRLTASPGYRRAVDYTEGKLREWGLDSVHREAWEFGRGWEVERLSLEMLEPRYMPLIGYPKGWSPSTTAKLLAGPIFLGGKTASELKAYGGKLAGAIVMTQPIRTSFIKADRPPASGDLRQQPPPASPEARAEQQAAAQELNAMLQRERPGLILEPNIGEHGTVFVTGRDPGPEANPTIVLASEHYNLIARMVQQGLPV